MKKDNLTKISLVVGIILSVTLIINTSLSAYVLYTSSFQASMSDADESLDLAIRTDTGRPTMLERIFKTAKDWISAYYVGGVEKTDAETGITISVTGSNVASQASVSYYIEGVPQSGGRAFRFLEGNGSSVTVGGAALSPTNQTTIEKHLTAMGLSTTSSHTIDYYVYVKAEATGAISGDTLTSEISYQKFDSVTYNYGQEYIGTMGKTSGSTEVFCAGEMILGQGSAGTGYSPDYNGTLYRILFKAKQIDGGADDVCGVVYKWTTGGGISDLVAQSDDCTGYSTGSWKTVSGYFTTAGTVPIYTNENYWLGAWFEEDDSNADWKIYLDYSPGAARRNYNTEYRSGISAPDPMTSSSENSEFQPYIYVQYKYISYSSSWYTIPPLSVINVPITLDLVAVLSVIIAALVVVKKQMEENKN